MNNCCEGKEICEHKDGEKCEHKMSCCHNWKKCHMMKKIVCLVIILLAFWAGTEWGERKFEWRGGDRFERGGMMNWGYGKFQNKNTTPEQTSGTGSVTVQVKAPVTDTTPTAPQQ